VQYEWSEQQDKENRTEARDQGHDHATEIELATAKREMHVRHEQNGQRSKDEKLDEEGPAPPSAQDDQNPS